MINKDLVLISTDPYSITTQIKHLPYTLYTTTPVLNHSLDVFSFQRLAGEPFDFFQREDKLGYNYAGEEYSLPYGEIHHYGCCSAAGVNPIQADNMVAFCALIGDDWYCVEPGIFATD